MSGRFRRDQVDVLLVACHRRCCICHRFCGVKIETDHIEMSSEGGTDDIGNAIPVCFECHAEIHSYNPKHPRGRKYLPSELKRHRDQWLETCREHPELFVEAARSSDVGPLQALIDELAFNARVVHWSGPVKGGCLFLEEQFKRAVKEGSIAVLKEELKEVIIDAYVMMGSANQLTIGAWRHGHGTNEWATTMNASGGRITDAKPLIEGAYKMLVEFLGTEPDEEQS